MPGENYCSSEKASKSSVGDGGCSWILRSYKCTLEQADAENKSLEEIVIKRWGSLEKLHALLQSAGIDPSNPDHRTSKKKYLYSSHSADHQRKDEGENTSHHGSHSRDDHEGRKRSHHDSHRRDDQGDRNMSHYDSHHKSGRKPESKGIFLKPGEGNSKPAVKYERESQT